MQGFDLNQYLSSADADIDRIGEGLDALDSDARLSQVQQLRPRAQARLFEMAAGARDLDEGSMVPPSDGNAEPVWHAGKNSLLAFRRFHKVFFRGEDDGKIWGYNATGPFLQTLVGPGYFAARAEAGEVIIDYTSVPAEGPPGAPPAMP